MPAALIHVVESFNFLNCIAYSAFIMLVNCASYRAMMLRTFDAMSFIVADNPADDSRLINSIKITQ